MKSWLIGILLITLLTDPLKISRINQTKREAREAFNKGDFKTAIVKYKYLSDSLGVKEDELTLNLAHAYFQTKDTANAYSTYQQLTASAQNNIRSKAQLQLGIMHHQQNKLEEALQNFKQAIKADPNNAEARYNYEMLKRKLSEEEKKKNDQKDKDKDPNKDKNQEPSAFAKKLKAQADQLVAQRKYQEAYTLMNNGLKQDNTVSHYQEYIDRIGDVLGISRSKK